MSKNSSKKTAVSIAWTLVKIAVLIVIVVALYKLCFVAYDFGYRIFADDAIDRAPGIEMTVTIVEGKTVKEIGEILEAKGLIRNATLFVLQEKFSDYRDELLPGVYELTTAMTPYEMMQIMSTPQEEVLLNDAMIDSEEVQSSEETGDAEEADNQEEAGQTGDQ